MLKKYRPFYQSAALLYLSEVIPALYLLKFLALAPLILELRQSGNFNRNLVGIFLTMGAWSLGLFLGDELSSSYPVLNGLALILYLISKERLGPQRSSLALLFFWLSAEGLAYSFTFFENWSHPYSKALFDLQYAKNWLSITGFLGASFWLLVLNYFAAYLGSKQDRTQLNWPALFKGFGLLILLGIVIPLALSPQSTIDAISEYPSYDIKLLPADLFLQRMSYFLAFFLLLFFIVKYILRNSKRDDRFT